MSEKPVLPVTRENLSSGKLAALVAERNDAETQLATDEQLLASRRAVVPDDADTSDIWVFGYGSLIFNPVMDFVDRASGRVFGYHRRFCLRTRLGRGTPDCPGLVLALDRGGSCTGVAFRLNPEVAIAELDLLWRREMVTGVYVPVVLNAQSAIGTIKCIAFIANHQASRICPDLPREEKIRYLATGAGGLGTSLEYLENLADHLDALGIDDPYVFSLLEEVRAYS